MQAVQSEQRDVEAAGLRQRAQLTCSFVLAHVRCDGVTLRVQHAACVS
jgi:hypothetical protein